MAVEADLDPRFGDDGTQHDDELMFRLSEELVPRSWDGGYADLNHAERVFVCVWELDATVQEGGLTQYFIDACGDHSADAVEALREIGAKRIAKLLERARRVFPGGRPSSDREERDVLLLERADDLEAKLQKLDEEYLEYPDDVTDLLSAYVAFSRDEFRLDEGGGCGGAAGGQA